VAHGGGGRQIIPASARRSDPFSSGPARSARADLAEQLLRLALLALAAGRLAVQPHQAARSA
jgi:hypothetical protein